jgi:hypothetical protein
MTWVVGVVDGFIIRRDEFLLLQKTISAYFDILRAFNQLPAKIAKPKTEAEKETERDRVDLNADNLRLPAAIADLAIRSFWPANTHFACNNPRGLHLLKEPSRGPFNDMRLMIMESMLLIICNYENTKLRFEISFFLIHFRVYRESLAMDY